MNNVPLLTLESTVMGLSVSSILGTSNVIHGDNINIINIIDFHSHNAH